MTADRAADEPTVPQSKHRPGRLRSFLGFVPDEPAHSDEYAGFDAVEPDTDASYDAHDLDIPPAHAPASSGSREAMEATAPQELADLLNEVASLAAPLDRASVPVTDESAPARTEEAPQTPSRWVEETPEPRDIEYMGASFAPTFAADAEPVSPLAFDDASETSAPPAPGRHVRRLHSQKPERRDWNPTLPGHRASRPPARRAGRRRSRSRPAPLALRRRHRRADPGRAAGRSAGDTDHAARGRDRAKGDAGTGARRDADALHRFRWPRPLRRSRR